MRLYSLHQSHCIVLQVKFSKAQLKEKTNQISIEIHKVCILWGEYILHQTRSFLLNDYCICTTVHQYIQYGYLLIFIEQTNESSHRKEYEKNNICAKFAACTHEKWYTEMTTSNCQPFCRPTAFMLDWTKNSVIHIILFVQSQT